MSSEPTWRNASTPWSSHASLAVEDAGPGVPPELRERIFEPFRQGSQVVEHSPRVGIELSLVARFAELHGGRAWVEERDGGGASFKVYPPDSRPPDSEAPDANLAATSVSHCAVAVGIRQVLEGAPLRNDPRACRASR